MFCLFVGCWLLVVLGENVIGFPTKLNQSSEIQFPVAISAKEVTRNGEEVKQSPIEGGQSLECATGMKLAQDGTDKVNLQRRRPIDTKKGWCEVKSHQKMEEKSKSRSDQRKGGGIKRSLGEFGKIHGEKECNGEGFSGSRAKRGRSVK